MLSRGFSPFKKNVCIIWELVKLLLSVSWEDTLLCDKQRVAIYKRAPNSTSLMTASYKYQTNLPDHPAWLKISNELKLKRHWLANMKFAEHLGKLLFTIILKLSSLLSHKKNPFWGGMFYMKPLLLRVDIFNISHEPSMQRKKQDAFRRQTLFEHHDVNVKNFSPLPPRLFSAMSIFI